MRKRATTPLGAVLRGALAGAAGTAAMDLVQWAQYRSGGGEQPFAEWELAGVDGWDGAPAPAQVGRRVAEGLLQRELGDEAANAANNVVHWGYGVAWGAVLGLLAARRPRTLWGPVLGTVVWLAGYAVLPATGLYQPMSAYDVETLARDWASHAVYGTAAATALRLIPG